MNKTYVQSKHTCNYARSFGGDATVLADYALTTTTTLVRMTVKTVSG